MERLRCRLQGKLVFYDMVCMYEQVAHKKYASDLCSKFSEIFKESADSCINENNNIMYKKGKKPWFGKQCERARKKYHIAKKKHAKFHMPSSKVDLLQASKTYKRKMNFFYCQIQ